MKKGRYMKTLVASIVILNIVFTIAVLYVVSKNVAEPSTLIASWFGFTTVELVNMAAIKSKKVNKEEKKDGDL